MSTPFEPSGDAGGRAAGQMALSQVTPDSLSPDAFIGALFSTSLRGLQVLQANSYFYQLCQLAPDTPVALSALMTPAANIMLDSYVLPLLLNQGGCEEIQLTLQLAGRDAPRRLPVLVNARLLRDDAAEPRIYWLMTLATQRDSLYQQLVDLRNALEAKAERLEQLSQTDELTGMLNRRAFNSRALALLNQRQRQGCDAVFLLLDIDFFKRINDSFGHDVGDRVLVEVAQRLKTSCRSHDVLARIGGEEFAVMLLPEQPAQGQLLAEKIRRLIAERPINGLPLTISIGIACAAELTPPTLTISTMQADDAVGASSAEHTLPDTAHPDARHLAQSQQLQSQFEQLYKLADRRLYLAKAAGRNQVIAVG